MFNVLSERLSLTVCQIPKKLDFLLQFEILFLTYSLLKKWIVLR